MEGKKKSEMIERHVIRDLKSARKQGDPNERNQNNFTSAFDPIFSFFKEDSTDPCILYVSTFSNICILRLKNCMSLIYIRIDILKEYTRYG